jgi:hypothetical protein
VGSPRVLWLSDPSRNQSLSLIEREFYSVAILSVKTTIAGRCKIIGAVHDAPAMQCPRSAWFVAQTPRRGLVSGIETPVQDGPPARPGAWREMYPEAAPKLDA